MLLNRPQSQRNQRTIVPIEPLKVNLDKGRVYKIEKIITTKGTRRKKQVLRICYDSPPDIQQLHRSLPTPGHLMIRLA